MRAWTSGLAGLLGAVLLAGCTTNAALPRSHPSSTTAPSRSHPPTTTLPPEIVSAIKRSGQFRCTVENDASSNIEAKRGIAVSVSFGPYRLVATESAPWGTAGPITSTVSRSGRVLATVTARHVESFSNIGDRPSVACLGAPAQGEAPTGFVGIYEGGAHGPLELAILYPRSASSYGAKLVSYLDVGLVSVSSKDGRFIMISRSAVFAYRWAAFAFTGLPLVVQHFADGRLVEVTRQFPDLLRKDASRWWHLAFHKSAGVPLYQSEPGPLSAWAADACRLEPTSAVWSTLALLLRAHRIHYAGAADGYVHQLERALVAEHFCRPATRTS